MVRVDHPDSIYRGDEWKHSTPVEGGDQIDKLVLCVTLTEG